MKPPKLSMKEKQKILSHSSTFRSQDEENREDVEERQDVEEEKRQQEKQQEDDALKIELARIKAEKEEAERRLAAAESALRRMAEEQSEKKKSEEQSVKKETEVVKKETEVVKERTREEDMKRLHELVPSAKSDMSVRAIYMKGARLLHPARGGDPKLYEELTHIYERLQKKKKKEEETLKKKRQSTNPFSSINVDTSTSSPLSEEQRLKIANFIRRERSKDWTAPTRKNPFASSNKPRRQSNNPFSPARERVDSPIKIKVKKFIKKIQK